MSRRSDRVSPKGDDMDISSDDEDLVDSPSLHDLGGPFLMDFCRKASTAFFHEYGLISHQINSFNDFIENGIQNVFDSFEDIIVEPGYDPSKKSESDWHYALVSFGKVTLDRPQFSGDKLAECGKESLNLLPRHARLQNMTYSSRMKVNIHFQVNMQFVAGAEILIMQVFLFLLMHDSLQCTVMSTSQHAILQYCRA